MTLDALYPHLAPEGLRAPDLALEVAAKAQASRETNERFFTAHASTLVAVARTVAATFRGGGKLLVAGNGGSSCDAAHVAVEFVHPVTAGRPALPALSLVADIAAVSAVGNDLGFEHVFVRQLIAHARRGDTLLGISTSGRSANLRAAFAKARELGLATIALVGGDGSGVRGAVDHVLAVESGSIHRIQECHVVAYHVLWDLVHTLLAGDRMPGPAPEAA